MRTRFNHVKLRKKTVFFLTVLVEKYVFFKR